jgi:PKD repeat protein
MKRACLLLLPALLLALASIGCNEEDSIPAFTRVRISPACGVAPMSVEGYAIVSGGDESGDPLGGNNNLEINWSWGDGGSGRTSIAYHDFQTPGEYKVTVTAKDPQGNMATETVTVQVMSDSLLIQATSSAMTGSVTTADTVQFDFSALSCDINYPTEPGDDVKVQVLWEMNDPDNHTYEVASPLFRFTTPGDYEIDLTVTYPAWAVTRYDKVMLTVTP